MSRRVRDVTDDVLRDSSSGPGKYAQRVATAKPAHDITPTLAEALAKLERSSDRSMGFISKPLAYSKAMPSSSREHSNVIRLIKARHVVVCQVDGPPPAGSNAHRDSPYGERYYLLRLGSCGESAPDGALGSRRRRK